MATTGDKLMENSPVPDSVDLKYVDHIESKLLSPDKETFSPSKAFKGAFDNQSNAVSPIEDIDVLNRNVEVEDKEVVNESGHSDTPLSSSNNGEEIPNERFVDRQESEVSVKKPDSISSPVKMVNDLFSFVDKEPQSLDAVNNNSELTVQESQLNEPIIPDSVVSKCYQGTEINLHETEGNEPQTKEAEAALNITDRNEARETTMPDALQREAEMNMYWYKSSLDVDPSELETFRSTENGSFTSSFQLNVGNNYYQSRVEDNSNSFQIDDRQNVKQGPDIKSESKEKWSPAFESASSRFLDLASEMKSDTRPRTTTKDPPMTVSAELTQQHPWGLEGNNNKVVPAPESKLQDELPTVEHLPADSVDVMDGDVPEKDDDVDDTDEADAVGYMELKDRDEIVKQSVSDSKDQPSDAGIQIDKDFRQESEQIVSTVVERVQCQVMSKTNDSRSEDKKSISSKVHQDTVDGSSNLVVEEALEYATTQQVEYSPGSLDTQILVREEQLEPLGIKRKFRMIADVEEKLAGLGGNLIEVENLIDEYLDDEDFSLCLSDCWLRLRNKKFEMKINEKFNGSSEQHMYNEIKNEKEIKKYLMQRYGGKLSEHKDLDLPLDVIVDKLGFTEFATFETVKKSYQLDNCMVEMDLTDFGLQVCEVEVIVDRPRKVLEALDTINDLAVKLDLRTLQGV